MKKLKNKVFFVIFGMLSIFLIIILVVFQYQNYQEERTRIVDALNRVRRPIDEKVDKDIRDGGPMNMDGQDKIEMSSNIFMDFDVYTVLIHDNKSYEIINYTGSEKNSDSILKYAKKIDTSKSDTVIGNLYTSLYSYSYKDREIVIVDNLNIRNRLRDSLKTSIFLFVMIEFVILLLAKALTSWIIKPVILTFNKQRQFIADASHELKTPLAIIMANTDALKSDRNEDKWLNNINEEAGRMNFLITHLLDLARLDEEKKVQYSEFNLSKELEKSILTFESIIYEKKLHLDYHIDENIHFMGDVEEFKQLFSVLMDNAIEHCSKKGDIFLSLFQTKKGITIECKNSGEGIPKGCEEKIFERFYRVDEAHNRDSNHYGLGLAIAKGIVEKYHGTISASSQNGYTLFLIKLKTISIS